MLDNKIDGCVLESRSISGKLTLTSERSRLECYCWCEQFQFSIFIRVCCVIWHLLNEGWPQPFWEAVPNESPTNRDISETNWIDWTRKSHPTPKHVQYHCCMTESKQHFLKLIFEDCCFMDSHLPDAKSKDVRDEKGGNEDFEEFSREDATVLHYSTLPHTKRHWTSRMLKVKLSEKNKQQAI